MAAGTVAGSADPGSLASSAKLRPRRASSQNHERVIEISLAQCDGSGDDLILTPARKLRFNLSLHPGLGPPNMMVETFKEFTFEAAHQIQPYSDLHGHSFKVVVYLQGEPDPVFGWSHNLYDVETAIDQVRGQLDHKYLNAIDGLAVPSLENVARWLWQNLDCRLAGVERVVVTRGFDGSAEGCSCARPHAVAA